MPIHMCPDLTALQTGMRTIVCCARQKWHAQKQLSSKPQGIKDQCHKIAVRPTSAPEQPHFSRAVILPGLVALQGRGQELLVEGHQ